MPSSGCEVLPGDITKMQVDDIVNAANTSLPGGGGVDGAIHRARGKAILEARIAIRNRQGGCKTGEAVITTAGNLQCKYVIHAVGPVWNGGGHAGETLLSNAYLNSLKLAQDHGIQTIAFPNISAGAYRFPKIKAAVIAIETVRGFFKTSSFVKKVIFTCFDSENYNLYRNLLYV